MRSIRPAAAAAKCHEEGRRVCAPLLGFPGVSMADTEIKLAQQNPGEHLRVLKMVADTFQPDVVFPLMDLSVEANALGRHTLFPREDSATLPKDHFDFAELDRMRRVRIRDDTRARGYAETVGRMKAELPPEMVKGAYVIGPYSLAALILGAAEAAVATIEMPERIEELCGFAAEVIREYAAMQIEAGAELVAVLEPTAVMLGPKQFASCSAAHVSHLVETFAAEPVSFVYHICGNSSHLVKGMADSGVHGLSLDSSEAGVNLPQAIQRVPPDVAVMGNISPTHTMLHGSPDEVERETRELLDAMAPYPNFILSTGCDLPQHTPIDNIHAFMRAGRAWRADGGGN